MSVHECGPRCFKHRSGLPMDEGRGVLPLPPERAASVSPASPSPTPDPICEECEDPLSRHDGPGGSNPWLACKHFVERGPKE